jgi:dihydrofolate reductase
MIRAIAAIDDNRGIAANGGIPWKIPEDGRYFREQTESGTVVMGWATYLEFAAPLPNRRNIVVSRTVQPVRDGFELVTDVDAFLRGAVSDIWVIGGAGLFASTLQYCDELYLTHVFGDFKCDRFFPPYATQYELAHESLVQTSGEYQFKYQVFTQK